MKPLENYLYKWPYSELNEGEGWKKSELEGFVEHPMPESEKKLSEDSRWPGFFPCAICFVTTESGDQVALEKVVGASIVNRFPYIVALSFCTKPLSDRHYVRENFMKMLEAGKSVAIHYFEPGEEVDKCMNAINTVDDENITERIASTGLKIIKAQSNNCPVFRDAYMVYEAKLVSPGKDFEGHNIFDTPWTDYGSHRIYYLEIQAIQLREDISHGQSQIHWRSLPFWEPQRKLQELEELKTQPLLDVKYQKGYTCNYLFPAKNTIGFDFDKIENGMCVKFLAPLPEDQVEVDNDNARWPCFFPSSVGMITTYGSDGTANLMPCGSTTMFIRHPLCIGICVSYANINVRYAPRESLETLLKNKKFVCGVPFANDAIIDAIKYAGNISGAQDKNKINHAGLQFEEDYYGPVLSALPISFKCAIVDIVRLGTHFLFLGEVQSILVRDDVNRENAMKWYSYPDVETVKSTEHE